MRKTILLALVAGMLLTACTKAEAPASPPPQVTPLECDPVVAVVPVVEAVAEPTEEVLPPYPFTDEEIIILAMVMTDEAQVLSWRGEQFGVSYLARQAAVAWVALNRYDTGKFGSTLKEVLTTPAQFAYHEETSPPYSMLCLADDVARRWWAEKLYGGNAGRTLPADYLFFEGDGKENYFRKEFQNTGEIWDWSLPDPYK